MHSASSPFKPASVTSTAFNYPDFNFTSTHASRQAASAPSYWNFSRKTLHEADKVRLRNSSGDRRIDLGATAKRQKGLKKKASGVRYILRRQEDGGTESSSHHLLLTVSNFSILTHQEEIATWLLALVFVPCSFRRLHRKTGLL